jgi:hypothetical protein
MNSRPDFIRPQDLIRWNKAIDSDESVPFSFKDMAPFREILFASFYLVEQLKKAGLQSDEIGGVRYQHGYQSFGNNPWDIAEELLNEYT